MADSPTLESYVRAALAVQGYAFDEATIARIVAQFARIETVARSVLALSVDERAVAAAVFRP